MAEEDLSRPAFRYSSSGRRPERLNQSRDVNAPLQLLRGWAAGTLGLPGDIEGLVRMLPGIQNETPVLPTSDFYREYLPGYDERPAARALSGLGALTGGMGATRVAREGLGAVKRATDVNAIRDYVRSAQGVSGMPGTAVVKPKGGNWRAGAQSPEASVERFRTRVIGQDPANRLKDLEAALAQNIEAGVPVDTSFFERERARLAPEISLNKWIDQKLASYVRNEMGTPEDPLRLQAEAFGPKKAALLEAKDRQIAKAAADMERARAARGFTPEMMTQSQARLRELRRERAQIEAQAGLHLPAETLLEFAGRGPAPDVAYARKAAGYPELGVVEDSAGDLYGGLTDQQRMSIGWENVADAPIASDTAGELAGIKSVLDQNPWLAKAPPETPVYNLLPGSTVRNENLGFQHLIDELRNAVNPESGLPQELLLKYEDLPRLSVAQAAKRVDDINAWRASQAYDLDQAIANNAATQVFKEYPEQGLRWVELKTPEMPEGWKMPENFEVSPSPGKPGTYVVKMDGRIVSTGYRSADEAAQDTFRIANEGALENALKYEGEQLSHCVGGYCPDVVEGRSRIFSLRDAEGRPHVTIETQPSRSNTIRSLREGAATDFDIAQIKGKSNRAPKEEYLPFVQDFVRSGQWGRVGDIENTGLIDARVAGRPMPGRPAFMTEDEFKAYQAELERGAEPREGFARGGAVTATPEYDPLAIDALADELLAAA